MRDEAALPGFRHPSGGLWSRGCKLLVLRWLEAAFCACAISVSCGNLKSPRSLRKAAEARRRDGSSPFETSPNRAALIENRVQRLYKSRQTPVRDLPQNPEAKPQKRRSTIIAAGLLLAALALVVLYTSSGAFMSPVALVVVAAIGLAALLLQLRLRPGLVPAVRAPLWLNVLGVALAVGAVFADIFRLSAVVLLVTALAAVVCFAVSGIIVIKGLRKRRT